jgi:hypothetical protein
MDEKLFRAVTMKHKEFAVDPLKKNMTAMEIDPAFLGRIRPASSPPTITPAPPTMPAPAVPVAPATNPFEGLPFPAPGDRIKADDFKALSQSLRVIADAFQLTGALFGRDYGEARQVLAGQQYDVVSVMSVFGTRQENVNDPALDARKVIQVIPLKLGERNVAVILTEAVETRRFAPNLLGLTYGAAAERLQALLGEITFPTSPVPASKLVGLSLKEAKQRL